MLRFARLLVGLLSGHARIVRTHTKARAIHLGLLAAFAIAAAVFFLVLVTVVLARAVGLLPALGIMLGLAVVACLVVYLVMQAEQRRHEAAIAQQKAEERRVAQAALVSALPMLRRGGLVTAGLGAVAAVVLARRLTGGRD